MTFQEFLKRLLDLMEDISETKKDALANIVNQKFEEETKQFIENTAQMRARKDEAYLERNKCVVLLAKMALTLGMKAGVSHHDPNDKNWEKDWMTIVYIDLPTGQVSWHFHDSHKDLLQDFPFYDGKWDGHTTEEKYIRVMKMDYMVPRK